MWRVILAKWLTWAADGPMPSPTCRDSCFLLERATSKAAGAFSSGRQEPRLGGKGCRTACPCLSPPGSGSRLYILAFLSVAWRQLLCYKSTGAVKQHHGHRLVILCQGGSCTCWLLRARSLLLKIQRFRYWGGNDLGRFLFSLIHLWSVFNTKLNPKLHWSFPRVEFCSQDFSSCMKKCGGCHYTGQGKYLVHFLKK